MQPNKPIPEFLCYKYKGLKRVDEIAAQAVQFGWKCRKYQNWKDVQNASDDKQLLLQFAEDLINGGQVRLADYGRIVGIFYNVQRWRKDKEALAEEPDLSPSWSELDALLNVVAENPRVAAQKLAKSFSGASTLPNDLIWDIFYLRSLLDMLGAQEVPNLPTAEFSSTTKRQYVDETTAATVTLLYSAVGLKTPPVPSDAQTRGLLKAVLKDLGLPAPAFDYTFSDSDFQSGKSSTSIVVCYKELGPLQLLKLTEIEGNIQLTINTAHAFVKDAAKDEKTKLLFESVLSAYAETVLQFPAQRDSLDSTFAYLGMALKRRASAKTPR